MAERDIFLAATEIDDPTARSAFLDHICAGKPALRAQVEALLRSHAEMGSFLHTPIVAEGGPQFAATLDFDPDAPTAGDLEESLSFLLPTTRPDSLGRIGHYEMLQVLGRGGFGIVFRAFDNVLQRVVAVKVMAPLLAATSPARKRFLREARSSAQIRHENVVQVYEVGETPLPYLVMEFIPGETLQARLDRMGPVDVSEVVRIGRQIAEGLAAAHAVDLIHRDIKPGNILLEGNSLKVKLTDFGLARTADDASISQSGIVAGTPMYMAPEQAKGETLDQRADLFSLGSVLYQMVSGRPPFRASTTLAVLKRVAEDAPRPIHEIIPETPEWLIAIIARLHAKDVNARFQSARDVADILADCEVQLKTTARVIPRTQPASTERPSRRRPQRLWVAALVLVPVLAVAGYALTQPKPSTGDRPTLSDQATSGQTRTPSQENETAWQRLAGLPAPQQAEAVRRELQQRNPDYHGEIKLLIVNDEVQQIVLTNAGIHDLTPLRALPNLQRLECTSSTLQTLPPLAGLPITNINIRGTRVGDLRPLQGLKLTEFECSECPNITDFEALTGMPLVELRYNRVPVTDITPLTGLPLKKVTCDFQPTRDTAVLRAIPTLEFINNKPVAEFWNEMSNSKATPFTDADVKRIAALPAAEQVEQVREELKRRNPRFDGKLTTNIEDNVVTQFEIVSNDVVDIAPIRALKGLKTFVCAGLEGGGKLTDLTPLRALPLTALDCNNNRGLTDLTPVQDLRLTLLHVHHTAISDLRAITKMRLEHLNGAHTKVADLTPLKGMPLITLYLDNCKATDVSAIHGAPLKLLNIRGLELNPERTAAVIGSLDRLEEVNGLAPAAFLKELVPNPDK